MVAYSVSLLVGLLAILADATPQVYRRQAAPMPRSVPKEYGRSDKCKDPVTPKVLILATYFDEANIWPAGMPEIYNLNITVRGLMPNYPVVHCTAANGVCMMVTGQDVINAATTMLAIAHSELFDLRKSYVMVAGISGGNPEYTSTGSVTLARYAVQGDIQYQLASVPPNWASTSGYFALGSTGPNQYPTFIYGTEVYEVSEALRHRAATVARKAKLNDTAVARAYRQRYTQAAARKPPGVQECDTLTTNLYWHGAGIAEPMGRYYKAMTNGTGVYCSTESEDSGWLAALFRATVVGRADYTRAIIMRSISNYDRAPPGDSDYDSIFGLKQGEGSYLIGLQNLYLAGKEVVDDIVKNWHSTFERGIPTRNYVGDIYNTFDRDNIDIGLPSFYAKNFANTFPAH
ncbi:hypothetical protein TWF696_003773 [Orbilia brochopaga]|uniref:Purine nucleoside permease n=1 Tax=Orbilia brochopaga TaxID=3140254 RepID=A0AAV9V4F9_9PEZI